VFSTLRAQVFSTLRAQSVQKIDENKTSPKQFNYLKKIT